MASLYVHLLRATIYRLLAECPVREWHVEAGTGETVAVITSPEGQNYRLSLTPL